MLDYDRLFIGGDWVASVDSDVLVVRSPASGDVVGRVPLASAGDVEAAVVAARQAFDEGPWPHLSMVERAEAAGRYREGTGPVGPRAGPAGAPRERDPDLLPIGEQRLPAHRLLRGPWPGATRSRRSDRDAPVVPGPAVIRHSPLGVVAGVVPWNGPVCRF